MRSLRLPGTALISALAAMTAWLTMTSWSGFSEEPEKYLVPLAFGCAVVAVSGAGLRSARLHPLVVLLGQVALVTLWLNHRFAADTSLLGWIPTPDSVTQFGDTISLSVDAAKSYAAPVPHSVPTFPPILILVGSFCAVLVDFLACGLRRVPLSGLPLLAMYTAPVSLLDIGVSWWRFGLVALCFLFLLAAEEAARLAHWGRDIGSPADTTPSPWSRATNESVWPSARKIGVTATAMAVVIPIFIPTFSAGILSGTGNGDGGGGGGVRITNPILDMKRNLSRGEDEPVLEVTTADPAPEYFRLAVLDEFDGSRWKPGKRAIPVDQRADGELPAAPGLDPGVRAVEHSYEVSVAGDFRSGWLPAPYPTTRVEVSGDWRYDLSTMDIVSAANGKTAQGLKYDLTALDVQPTPDELRGAGAIPSELFTRYTKVAENVPDWVQQLAERVTASGTNRAERAALLQRWFTEPHQDDSDGPSFTYDISKAADGSSIEALQDFLLHSRTGYCEQFAGAMALMARTLSIPARVAVGFLKPDRVGNSSWVFSTHDLHAWPEIYFEDVGWVRFEPTPSSRQGADAPSYTLGLQPSNPENPLPSTATSAATGSSATASRAPDLPPEPVQSDTSLNNGGPSWLLISIAVLVVLLILAALPRVARTLGRRRRWAAAVSAADQAEAAWGELRDSMIDLRLPWDDRVTVRQRAQEIGPLFCRHPGPGEEGRARVIRDNPEAQAALSRIVVLIERARYARTPPDVEDVKGDIELCVSSLRIGVDKNDRRRADWLPASLFTRRLRRAPRVDSGLALSEPSLTR